VSTIPPTLPAVANVRARHERCCRCEQRIDYRLAYPDPDSFSVDHCPYPWSTHPWLATDPGNLKAAHLHCNRAARDEQPRPGLGEPSEEW
jgi:hypothetical protein